MLPHVFISGVYSVAYAFPKVKIVTTAVDKAVNDKFHILPGIGMYLPHVFLKVIFFHFFQECNQCHTVWI